MQSVDNLLRRKQNVTLAEVAKLSGVSEITVSRVLRNKGAISEATRAKVLEAVQLTGYVPNKLAGSLASAQSNLIGVIIPSLSNIVFPEVLEGINAALEPSGMQSVVGVTHYDRDTEEQLVRSLLAWKPHAMVIVGFEHTEATRQMLLNADIRIAELMDIDSPPIDIAVGMSHRRAGYGIGRYLIERGYRRFGYCGHDWVADHRARLRFDGLSEALEDNNLSLVDVELYDGPSSTIAGKETLAKLLARGSEIDVVVFSNDDMATGGVFHCMAANIVLKKQLAIFGFNGLEIGKALPQPLSTLLSHRYEIGKIAVEHILESRQRGDAVKINTGYQIIVGETA
jgi:LacI family gluconate utilization system Gnt-I transcriptional repressor